MYTLDVKRNPGLPNQPLWLTEGQRKKTYALPELCQLVPTLTRLSSLTSTQAEQQYKTPFFYTEPFPRVIWLIPVNSNRKDNAWLVMTYICLFTKPVPRPLRSFSSISVDDNKTGGIVFVFIRWFNLIFGSQNIVSSSLRPSSLAPSETIIITGGGPLTTLSQRYLPCFNERSPAIHENHDLESSKKYSSFKILSIRLSTDSKRFVASNSPSGSLITDQSFPCSPNVQQPLDKGICQTLLWSQVRPNIFTANLRWTRLWLIMIGRKTILGTNCWLLEAKISILREGETTGQYFSSSCKNDKFATDCMYVAISFF